LMIFALIFGYRGKRIGIAEMLMAVIGTGRVSLDIILIGAAAGIMVGVMSISGLAFSMTLQLVALSGDNVFALLLLIAVLAFLLGTAAVVGFALGPLDRVGRAIYASLALAVVVPPEAFGAAFWVNVIGIALSIGMLAFDYVRRPATVQKNA